MAPHQLNINMLSCSICSDKYLHICATCKLRLCKNHKLIHQKDKSKSHNFKSSNQAAECLNFSGLVSEIPRVATVKVIPCTPNLPFTQKTQDILNWYSQEYPVSSKPVKNLNLKKAKYFKFALAQENKIFLSAHTSVIRSILITKDNQYIISASNDRKIRIWNYQYQVQEFVLIGHTNVVSCIATTSDSKYLVSGSWDTTIIIWSLHDKVQESLLKSHTNLVDNLKITSNDLYIVSSSSDNTIGIWNIQNRMLEMLLIKQNSSVNNDDIVISRDNKYLVYPSNSGLVIWNLIAMMEKVIIERIDDYYTTSIALVSDNKIVASGYENGRIILWNVRRRRVKTILRGHSQRVNNLEQELIINI